MQNILPNYIVIEGPIGVGKSSLATRLANDFQSELILEQVADNPFLEQFYQRPREAALSTQLSFLLQRTKQIQNLRQGNIFTQSKISDYLIEKDQLFAQVTLTPTEYELYQQVYDHLIIESPRPDLVVYLQAPVSTLLERIKKRGRHFEKFVESGYLEQLNEVYADFFYHYEDAPLLIVNASNIDFINNDLDYAQLKEQITSPIKGRHYFNPLPFVS